MHHISGFGAGALGIALVAGIEVGPAGADEAFGFGPSSLRYERCYRASAEVPGPAAAYGEDVCVEYEATYHASVRSLRSGNGPEALRWSSRQEGSATVYARADRAVLDAGFFRIEEAAEDVGGDARCRWAVPGAAQAEHASVETCAAGLDKLDSFAYTAQIAGSVPYLLRAYGAGEGGWCGVYGDGTTLGAGCR